MKRLIYLLLFIAGSLQAQPTSKDLYTATASGTNNYSVILALPNLYTYVDGERFLVTFTNANTGPSTLNRNSLGAKPIVKNGSSALEAGDIAAGQTLLLAYDGTKYQLVGSTGSSLQSGSIGSIASYSSFTSLTGFTASTGTATVGSGVISVSGGDTGYTKSIQYNYTTSLDKFSLQGDFKATSLPVSDTEYFGFGIRSTASLFQSSWSIGFWKNGAIVIRTGSNAAALAGSFTLIGSLGTAMVVNHVYQVYVEKNQSSIFIRMRDVTAGTTPVFYTYDGLNNFHNVGNPTIWNLAGTFDIQNFYFNSKALRSPNILVVGDSKSTRSSVTALGMSYNDLLDANFHNVETNAGAGEVSADVVSRLAGELTTIKAKVVLLAIGRNDIALGVSAPTWQANLNTIYNSLVANGSTVYFMLPFYETAVSQSALSTWILANYPNNYIDASGVISLNADNIHPDDNGHYYIYQAIVSSGNLAQFAKNYSTIKSGSIPVVNSNGVMTTSPSLLFNTTNPTKITLGNASATGGSSQFMGNVTTGLSTYLWHRENNADKIMISLDNGSTYNSSAAPELGIYNWVSGAWILGINSTGQLAAGGAHKPTAALHLAAGKAAANTAPLKFNSGTLQTTAEAGTMEYDGKAFYGSAAASSRQVIDAEQFMSLTATYTLTSQTALQKIFNATTNGALTVQASTSYFFECEFDLSAMSASSGDFSFGFGGTATLTSLKWTSDASKNAVGTPSTSQMVTATVATATSLVTANTTTTGHAYITGIVRVNAGGTLIPQVGLGVAAAAVVGTNSWFRITPIGTNTVTNVGHWN